jgi:hypothetical protein
MGLTRGGAWLAGKLALPATKGCDVDDPRTTALRRQIIEGKPFLKNVYEDWYRAIAAALPAGDGPVLELGAGAGFMRQRVPRLIASDILHVPTIALVADATRLPPDVRAFFLEAARCVKPGGALVMIEPWVTAWSSFVYRRVHAEPFEPAAGWSIAGHGPLSGANGALPWIVFERDRAVFEREFPAWQVRRIEPQMPFRYLLSGGVSLRSLAPAFTYVGWRRFEQLLTPLMPQLAMFATIVVTRTA